jgi:hypothetical protein
MRALIEVSQNLPASVGKPLTRETSGLRVVDSNETEAQVLQRGGDILRELHTLLEDYAPVWYTERYQTGMEQILRDLNKFNCGSATATAR